MKTLPYVTAIGVLGGLIVVACSGGDGGGAIPTVGNGYDIPPTTGYQTPGSVADPNGGQSSGTTQDAGQTTTTSSSGASGTSGTSGTTTDDGCPKCNQTLQCQGDTGAVVIAGADTACQTPVQVDGGTIMVTFACGGMLTANGQSVGSWTANGTNWTITTSTGTASCTGQ